MLKFEHGGGIRLTALMFPTNPVDILLISEEEGSFENYISALLRYCGVYQSIAEENGEAGWPVFHLPHMGTAALAAYLRANGFNPAVIDNIFHVPANWERFRRIVAEGVPAVGISTSLLFRRETVRRIIDEARAINPDVVTVIGGASACRPEIMDLGDVVVKGPGEKPLAGLLAALKNGRPLDGVPGISFRRGGRMESTGDCAGLTLDELPPPDWDVLPAFGPSPCYLIEASRGCNHNCAFCAYPGDGLREVRSPSLVAGEMERNRKKYGIRLYRFIDSDFLLRPEKSEELCDLLIRSGLNVQWSCYTRVDALAKHPRLAGKMRKAGCVSIFFGIDSGDENILRSMRKGYGPREILKGTAIAKEAGIFVHGNFIVGFPGETAETVNNTLKVVSEAGLDTVAFFLFCLSRDSGSPIWNDKKRWGIEGEGTVWRHRTMDSREAEAHVDRAMNKVLTEMPDRLIGIPHWLMLLLGFGLATEEYLPHLRDVRDYHLCRLRGNTAGTLAAAEKILATLRRINSLVKAG